MAIKLWSVNELFYKVGSEPNHQPKKRKTETRTKEQVIKKKRKEKKKKNRLPRHTLETSAELRRAYGLRNLTAIKSFCPYGFT